MMAAAHSPLASFGDGQGLDGSRKSSSCRLGLGFTPSRMKLGFCPERPTLCPESSAMAKARILPCLYSKLRLKPAASRDPTMRGFLIKKINCLG